MRDGRNFGFVVAAAIFLIDQLSKWLVTDVLGISYMGARLELLSFFDLRFVPNVGVSLGLLPAESPTMRWALVALTGGIAVAVGMWLAREPNRNDRLALALVLGGALGNILDRIRFGYVVDFADLHFGEWRPFLVFNVADAAITIGVVILLLRALFVRDKPAIEPSNGADKPAPVEKMNA
ncbi:signal peptidase II [Sphingomonas qomolangmaensis]|uniref:Lipoprotein signal peptidase n=1 Tax=Sphingomonas qomolangmaensis TaxID=2918765 RepID=A0ABY5L625_9SPHN|nr:signal peptidase II [Sphingomonas qomolangmaensis]UUL81518.1 signal peptidase II [Sphingomonas qomolangmaensis]